MKKIILSVTATLFLASAIVYANGTTQTKSECKKTTECVECPCTPECQPGDPCCVCPFECKK